MSLDIAKKLYQELLTDRVKMDEFRKDPAGFLKAGAYDCTADEIKEAMDHPLDEKELQQVAGGLFGLDQIPTVPVNPIDPELRDKV